MNNLIKELVLCGCIYYNNRNNNFLGGNEPTRITETIKYVPEDRRDETTNAVLKAAADSISLEKIKSLTDIQDDTQQKSTDLSASEIKFSQKELKLMPRKFRQLFRVQGMTARVYRRESGKGNQNYEIRLRTHGYNIYASSNNLEEAKHKFIDKLNEYEKYGDTKSSVPDTFVKFTEYFFDNFYSVKSWRARCALQRVNSKTTSPLILRMCLSAK